MDVISVESCVQGVIEAYRGAAKLVQRLKTKETGSADVTLPEDLTKEFEDSLKLGTAAVQSQYDHDARRFGETYARGDAIAREQMKDILILLQGLVISHLREVFMEEAVLDLHILKETSDDCRVNAIVCLGQLYQRMSVATAAMRQLSRPTPDEQDKSRLLASLAYSSSRSTQSSGSGRLNDFESITSYTASSSPRTTLGHNRKSFGGAPLRGMSLDRTEIFPHNQLKKSGPDADGATIVPADMQIPTEQMPAQLVSNLEAQSQAQDQHRPLGDLGRPPNQTPPFESNCPTEDRDHAVLANSTYHQHRTVDQDQPIFQASPIQTYSVLTNELNFSRPRTPVRATPTAGNSATALAADKYVASINSSTRPPSHTASTIPLNPDFSTLEFVGMPDIRRRAPPSPLIPAIPEHQYQQFLLQLPPHLQQQVQQSMFAHHDTTSPPSQTQTDIAWPTSLQVSALRTLFPDQKQPTVPPPGRPLSTHSNGSGASRRASSAIRPGLPPGIADAIRKPSAIAIEAQFEGQPRYVKSSSPNPASQEFQSGRTSLASEKTSTTGDMLESMTTTSASMSDSVSLEAKMRMLGTPSELQVSRSRLNIPSEANLAGFCKGAVRQQMGARKKGFMLEHRRGPAGQQYFWRCSKCDFEGAAAVTKALPSGGRGSVKVEKTLDNTVRRSPAGIKYRWNFLAKCHVSKKLIIDDGLNNNDVFGCYFCCVEGDAKGWLEDGGSARVTSTGSFGKKAVISSSVTPTYHGLDVFLAHLDTHRQPSRMPGLIAANEMNSIVGRLAHDYEDFDLNLPPLET